MPHENIPGLLLALGHEGPNFEENRKYLGKIQELIKRTWQREEIPPSRIIPLSLRNLFGILAIRTQFPFRALGEVLYKIVATPFQHGPQEFGDSHF